MGSERRSLGPARYLATLLGIGDQDVMRVFISVADPDDGFVPRSARIDGRGVCTRSDPNESNQARISAYRAAASSCRGARLTMNAAGGTVPRGDGDRQC
jgi:hypothetical protein